MQVKKEVEKQVRIENLNMNYSGYKNKSKYQQVIFTNHLKYHKNFLNLFGSVVLHLLDLSPSVLEPNSDVEV